MKVPSQNKFHRPILKALSDEQTHLIQEIRDELTLLFRLDQKALSEKLPSGDKTVFESRYGWARYDLKKFGFINTPKQGEMIITPIGLKELRQHKPMTKRRLSRRGKKLSIEEQFETLERERESPDDKIDQIIKDAEKGLREDLLEKLQRNNSSFFEQAVNRVLKEEYKQEIIQLNGGPNDHGIDGIIGEEFDQIAIQSKRYKAGHEVGENDIHVFYSNIDYLGAPRGIFVTASTFHNNTSAIRKKFNHIRFIDGNELVDLMIKNNIGVSKTTHEVKSVDDEFFVDEAKIEPKK